MRDSILRSLLTAASGLFPFGASAYDVNDWFRVEIAARTFVQYGQYSNAFEDDGTKIDNKTKAVGIADLSLDLRPTDQDEMYTRLRFVKGNGLNKFESTAHASYGGDLRDDVKDINGTNRNYLLEAWYKHTFDIGPVSTLGATVGIIDSAAYIDDNAYANDADSQFMNEVFSNSNLPAFPAYAGGGALEFDSGQWSLRTVFMNLKNDDDRSYKYFAGQVGYRLETHLGEGNYRLFSFITNDRFQNASGNQDDKRLKGVGISADQQLGDILGVFLRTGFQGNDAAVDFDKQFSFGVNINGSLWGRPQDEIGVGWSFLDGEDESDYENTNLVEAYIKFQLSEYADLSLDVQYEKDRMNDNVGSGDPKLWVVGTRFNAYF